LEVNWEPPFRVRRSAVNQRQITVQISAVFKLILLAGWGSRGHASEEGVVLQKGSFLLSELSPSVSQKRVAAAIAGIVAAAFIAVFPFRDRQLPTVTGFISVVDTILFFTDLVTAVLLYAQFSALRTYGVLALATGYLFTALLIVAHLLTFPGALAPMGLLDANLQSSAWLYIFWHFGIPPAVIAYTLLKNYTGAAATNVRRAVFFSVCAAVILAATLTLLVTVYARLLPPIMIDYMRANARWENTAGPVILIVSLISMALLWRRHTSLLDTWLMVVLWALFIETLLLSMTSTRFSLTWYAGRAFGMVSSSFVLLTLLYESTMLYARLAASIAAHEREHEGKRLSLEVTVGSIAHELRQPLTAIVANCDAGMQLLTQVPADVPEAAVAFKEIRTEGLRASDIITSIQATLADAVRPVAMIDTGQLIRETLTLLRTEIQFHGVAVQVQTAPDLPPILGNKGQLLQVLVNLITNAVDSMREITTRPRVINIRADVRQPALLSIQVEDSGVGITPELVPRIFEPLFTTKSRGTGLGLAICRSIVEAHAGRIGVTRGSEYGSVFQVLLPVAAASG
jgi:signal transduction histidine kinase